MTTTHAQIQQRLSDIYREMAMTDDDRVETTLCGYPIRLRSKKWYFKSMFGEHWVETTKDGLVEMLLQYVKCHSCYIDPPDYNCSHCQHENETWRINHAPLS